MQNYFESVEVRIFNMVNLHICRLRRILIFFIGVLFFQTGIAQMQAKFRVKITSKCAPAKVVFYNESTDADGATRYWDFGSGKYYKQEEDTLVKYFYKPGNYTIKLKLEKAGVIKETSQTINLFKKPEAKFEIKDGKACGVVNATLTDASIAGSTPINQWEWDFRNGEKKTGKEVKYSYDEVGTYDVLLKVTDENSCVSFYEIEDEIEVLSLPELDFHSDKQYWCKPAYFSFSADVDTKDKLEYRWHIGKSIQEGRNVSLFLSEEGYYDVSLAIWNEYGCYDSIMKKSYIHLKDAKPKFDIKASLGVSSYDTICPGNTEIKNLTDGTANFTWFINDKEASRERDLKYHFKEPGEHKIVLQLGDRACTRTYTDHVTVDSIIADFKIDKSYACAVPSTFKFTNTSKNAVSYKWEFNDGTSVNTKDANYTVKSIERTEDPYKREIESVEIPVKLYATNKRSCTNEQEKSIEFTFPHAHFAPSITNGCAPLSVEFKDRSISDSDINTYTWLLGDSDKDGSEKFTHTFNIPGVYDVRLRIVNDSSCVDTSQVIQIRVGEILKPDFEVLTPQVCNAELLKLKNNTPDASKVDYSHFFSDNIFSLTLDGKADANILMDPLKAGLSDITLEVSNNGCISSIEKKNSFEVLGPVVSFINETNCGDPLSYNFLSDIQDAESYIWDFGNGTTSTDENPTQHFDSNRNYKVELRAQNASTGCADTLSQDLYVQKPEAIFFTNPDTFACVYNLPKSEFDFIKTDAYRSEQIADYCNAEPYSWNFGDSRTWERTAHFKHMHAYTSKPKEKTKISLVVEDNKGCTDTLTKEYRIYEPEIEFLMDTTTGCFPKFDVEVTNTNGDASVKDFYWIFEEKDTVWNKLISKHTFKGASQQSYTISLTANDKLGCDNRVTKNVELIKPNPYFYYDKKYLPKTQIEGACINEKVYFSSYPSYVTDSSVWEIDSKPYKGSLPFHSFDNWGEREILHKAYRYGCVDSLRKKIIIEKPEAAFLSLDTTQECNMVMKFLHKTEKSEALADSSYWIFDKEGRTGKYKNDTVFFTFTKPGIHHPKLILQTKYGCKDTSSTKIEILRPWAEYTLLDKELCAKEKIQVNVDTMMYATDFYWVLEDNSDVHMDTLRHYIDADGSFTLGLHVENDTLPTCTFDAGIDVRVHKVIADFALNDPDSRFCLGSELALNNTSQRATKYKWYRDGDMFTKKLNPERENLNTVGDYEIQLVALDGHSCSDTIQKQYTVVPLPGAEIIGDYHFCQGADSLQLEAKTNSTANSINWQPVWYTNTPNVLNPKVMLEDTTTFEMQVTSPDNCISTATVSIPFIAYPRISRYPNRRDTVIYPEAPLYLKALSSNPSEYQWSPDYLTDAPNEALTYVYPEDSTVFTVYIKDICFETRDTFYVAVHEEVTLDMPKAFLPEGNAANQKVYVRGKGIVELIEFKVFNRLGNQIFSSTNLREGWDGKYQGALLPGGTYAYTVRVRDYRGNEHEKHGTILLIR